MLNPGLQASLFRLPVRPIIVETTGADFNRITSELRSSGLELRNATESLSMASFLAASPRRILEINDIPGVRAVHADSEKSILITETFTSLIWPTSESRRLMGAEEAVQQGVTGEAVRVGIVDTGADPNHPQLRGIQWDSALNAPREPGIDAGPTQSGHGSHVASTVGGTLQLTPTQVFVEGVSRARMNSVQALGRIIGTGFSSEVVNAISLAFDRGARIINMSLGSDECQGGCDICPECRAVKQFTARGVIFVIAAGNSGPGVNTINCPGCVPEAITVGAVDRNSNTAEFSSRGGSRFSAKPDVVAPGVDIFSGTGRGSQVDLSDAQAGFGFAAISGTSMATPHVAGLLALLRQRDPELTAESFRQVMRTSGLPFNTSWGYGVPNWSMFV